MMIEVFPSATGPRVYAAPVGVDFCASLIAGLDQFVDGQGPEAIANIEILVANARMGRRLQSLYIARGPGFLPCIRPVMELSDDMHLSHLPKALPPLRLRLELADLIAQLMDRVDGLAPRAALYDLSDSLADLMGEMFEEGVTAQAISALDVGTHADHWKRAQALLGVVNQYFGEAAPLTREARQTRLVAELQARWRETPPEHPVLVAGSTGSRGATFRLMQAVAGLPQGAVVLPGIDRDLPQETWRSLLKGRRDGLAGEDHPQFRIARFAEGVGLEPWAIPDWPGTCAPQTSRNKAVSLALRPAPVTDQWRAEGPKLAGLREAFAGVTLIEAATPQVEAAAIAVGLREAAERGQRAALVCPDPRIIRQVTAALDRWGILPDDSAGVTLDQTPSGRFLRHVAELDVEAVDPERLVVILKHPICHSGTDRGTHMLRTRELELQVLRRTPGVPSRARLMEWADARKDDTGVHAWVAWVCDHVLRPPAAGPLPMPERIGAHVTRAEVLAAGAGSGEDGDQGESGGLYTQENGEAARALIDELEAASDAGGAMSARDYASFFASLTADRQARHSLYPNADILIWGTMEARVQGADLLILSGLNEGTWPGAPSPDPWLNRAMRAEVGLRLPDRQIGLAAHDFQQAIAAPTVWITRAKRDDETDTVPSRWLNRLTNLLRGSGGEAEAALADMRGRGAAYLAMAEHLMTPEAPVKAEPRPAPVPPVFARPKRLSVTELERLIRDPYAVYARRVLRLYPLNPLQVAPDARLRGIVMHDVMRAFVDRTVNGLPERAEAIALLLRQADETLDRDVPGASARRLWLSRMRRAGGAIVEMEADLRAVGQPLHQEAKGELIVPGLDITLTGYADRIDLLHDGGVAIYDYKTGALPTDPEEKAFNKQLWLEAMMVEAGAFGLPPATRVQRIAYLGLGPSGAVKAHEVSPADIDETRAAFLKRLRHMLEPETGFASRRRIKDTRSGGDYDHLARFGEWDDTQVPVLLPVGTGRPR